MKKLILNDSFYNVYRKYFHYDFYMYKLNAIFFQLKSPSTMKDKTVSKLVEKWKKVQETIHD